MTPEILQKHIEFVGLCEAPTNFNIWAILSVIGAALGRNISYQFGHNKVYPNMYTFLVGPPASMKSYSIGIGKDLLKKAGYDMFSPNRAAKETIWSELEKQFRHSPELDVDLDILSFDDITQDKLPREMYIAQGEMIDFLGEGNNELIANLTNLWDNLDEFNNPKLTKKSVKIMKPTINILGGFTPNGLNEAFSTSSNEGGFFSRVIFVYSDIIPGLKITFPEKPNQALEQELVWLLKRIYEFKGEITVSPEGVRMMHKLYKTQVHIQDTKLAFQIRRRFIQCIKVAMVLAAARLELVIQANDIIVANTLLAHNEKYSDQIFSSYGTAKLSSIQNQILKCVRESKRPISKKQLWKIFAQDLNKVSDLDTLLTNLIHAEKIQKAANSNGSILGYISSEDIPVEWSTEFIDKETKSWLENTDKMKVAKMQSIEKELGL
jgi:hypothetical protein